MTQQYFQTLEPGNRANYTSFRNPTSATFICICHFRGFGKFQLTNQIMAKYFLSEKAGKTHLRIVYFCFTWG